MENETEANVEQELLEYAYQTLASTALLSGLAAVVWVVLGRWHLAALCYLAATVARLAAGSAMNRMGKAETVNAWNDKHHRFVVIALNSGVGAVLLGKLWWERWDLGVVWGNKWGLLEARWFLAIAIALYLVAQRFTRPNTFGARVRSAMLTLMLIGTMAYLVWPWQWGLIILAGVITLNFVWFRLRTLQSRFGWANR